MKCAVAIATLNIATACAVTPSHDRQDVTFSAVFTYDDFIWRVLPWHELARVGGRWGTATLVHTCLVDVLRCRNRQALAALLGRVAMAATVADECRFPNDLVDVAFGADHPDVFRIAEGIGLA